MCFICRWILRLRFERTCGALKPVALVLMESELWPRMLHECRQRGVPVVVANARMSDRSFARAQRMQWIWGRVMRKPSLWLAQSEQDALRMVVAGARTERVRSCREYEV